LTTELFSSGFFILLPKNKKGHDFICVVVSTIRGSSPTCLVWTQRGGNILYTPWWWYQI